MTTPTPDQWMFLALLAIGVLAALAYRTGSLAEERRQAARPGARIGAAVRCPACDGTGAAPGPRRCGVCDGTGFKWTEGPNQTEERP